MPEPANAPPGHSFKGLLRQSLSALDRTTEFLEKAILGSTVLFLAGLLVAHVIGRQLFGSGVTGQVELTQMALVIMTFSGLGYGVRRARHISMSAFYDQLKGTPRKVLLTAIHLITAFLMFYFAWHAWDYVSAIQSRGRTSSALQIPLWIPYMVAPIGFALAGVQYLLTVIRNLLSKDLYRSFSEKETYDDVPTESDGGI